MSFLLGDEIMGKKIHYGSPHNYTACGLWANHPLDPKPITYNKRKVTCKRCRKTREYKQKS